MYSSKRLIGPAFPNPMGLARSYTQINSTLANMIWTYLEEINESEANTGRRQLGTMSK